jgi:hypothetical protein
MITYYLLIILLNLLALIVSPISALQDVVLPVNIASSISSAGAYLSLFYGFLPNTLTALVWIMSSYVFFELAIWAYKMIKWIYIKIPGIN